MNIRLLFFLLVFLGAMPTISLVFGQPQLVDLQLQQLVDVSTSIDTAEFNAQRDAWAAAFSSNAVKAAILDPNFNSMCIQFIYWSGGSEQQIILDWKIVSDAASADAVKTAILNAPRPFSGGTEPDDAINFGVSNFQNDVCVGIAKIIDVSGDGTGSASATSMSSDDAISAGIDRINGLVLGSSTLKDWYETNIKRGPDAFVLQVTTQPITAAALTPKAEQKILMEIESSINIRNQIVGGEILLIEPTSLLLVGIQSNPLLFLSLFSIISLSLLSVFFFLPRKN